MKKDNNAVKTAKKLMQNPVNAAILFWSVISTDHRESRGIYFILFPSMVADQPIGPPDSDILSTDIILGA